MATLEASPASAYDALAPYYDAFTAHPNYPTWVRSLEALARSHGLAGHRALDIGCGTGLSIAPLLALGYDVTGCDVSPAMLAEAARKLPAHIPLIEADVRTLPPLGPVDLVWCVNDTINYLTEPEELVAAFGRVAGALAPGGLFVFDVNTLRTYRTSYADTAVREADGLLMTWVGSGTSEVATGDVLDARIEVFELDERADRWRRSTSRHRQRCHSFREIRAALDSAGLRLAGTYGLTEDAAIEPTLDGAHHKKAIFVVAPNHDERR